MSGLLLDTCAMVWLATGKLPGAIDDLVDEAAGMGEVRYSAISAWEIGLLGRARREGPRMRFDPDPATWLDRFRSAPGMVELPLTAEVALAAALLPADIHADPVDRFLIATARHHCLSLVTSDRRIIDYGAQGILHVIACQPEDLSA